MKCGSRIFCDELNERLPPRSTGVIEDFFAKLLEFFNTDYSDRFADGFAPLFVDVFGIGEFFEWHRIQFIQLNLPRQAMNFVFAAQ